MTKSELIAKLAARYHQLVAKDAELAVKMILDAMAKSLSQAQRIEIRGFDGGVDLHARIHLEHVVQAARVVAVAVGDDDEIQPPKVHAERLHVGGEIVQIAAGVEQDAPAGVLDERRVAPAVLHRRRLAEGVVEDGHPRRRVLGGCVRRKDRETDEQHGDDAAQDSHGQPSPSGDYLFFQCAPGSPPAAMTRASSPPETMSKPAPTPENRLRMARLEFAFMA